MLAPIEEIAADDHLGFEELVVQGDPGQLIGMAVGEWLQKDGVDHTKHGRVRANPEREGNEGGGGETPALAEGAKGVSDVRQHWF